MIQHNEVNDLEEKAGSKMKALITGANKGIGFAIATEMAKQGIEVFVGARSKDRGLAAVNELASQGLKAHYVQIDLQDQASIERVASEIDDLDILVNNAGIPDSPKAGQPALQMNKAVEEYSNDDLRLTMEVNFLGTHAVISQFLPKMTATGKIINLTVPIQPNEFWHPLAYMTSKAALNAMIMGYAWEFDAKHQQRQIFGVLPGAIATDLNGTMVGDLGGLVRSSEDAGKLITKLALDSVNHNGEIIQYDGKILSDYEAQLR